MNKFKEFWKSQDIQKNRSVKIKDLKVGDIMIVPIFRDKDQKQTVSSIKKVKKPYGEVTEVNFKSGASWLFDDTDKVEII